MPKNYAKYPVVQLFSKIKAKMYWALRRQGVTEQKYENPQNANNYPEIIKKHFQMSVDNALKNNGLDRIVVSDDGTTFFDLLSDALVYTQQRLKELMEVGQYSECCCQDDYVILDAPRLQNDPNGINLRYAFQNCYGLKSVDLGRGGMTSLAYTFHNCINLKTLTLGDLSKVTNITFAFYSTNVIDEIQIDTVGYYADWTYVEGYGMCKGYLVDLRSLTIMSYAQWPHLFDEVTLYMPNQIENFHISGWAYKIHLLGAQPKQFKQSLYNLKSTDVCRVNEITGLDCRMIGVYYSGIGPNNTLDWANSSLTHLEFAEGSYIRSTTQIRTNSSWDMPSIKNWVYQAYDWRNNPDNLTYPYRVTTTDTNVDIFSFHMSDERIQSLKAYYGDGIIEEMNQMLESRSCPQHNIYWKLQDA